jgi:hypothetical protein
MIISISFPFVQGINISSNQCSNFLDKLDIYLTDLGTGSYVTQESDKCQHLCINRSPCCDRKASCRCGTHSGNFECVCREGYYGTGLHGECYRKFIETFNNPILEF